MMRAWEVKVERWERQAAWHKSTGHLWRAAGLYIKILTLTVPVLLAVRAAMLLMRIKSRVTR